MTGPLEFDDEGTLIEKPERRPYQGWDVDPRVPDDERVPFHAPMPEVRTALWGCGARLILVAAILFGIWLLAAPRSAAVIPPPAAASPIMGLPGETDRRSTGAPLGEAIPRTRGIEPATTPDPAQEAAAGAPFIPAAVRSGQATWCKPTPRYCQSWGGEVTLGAVFSFTFGDAPYVVRVHRGDAHVDVTIVSHCECAGRDDLIDLSAYAFEQLAPLGLGRIDVAIEDLRGPAATLPPTDAIR